MTGLLSKNVGGFSSMGEISSIAEDKAKLLLNTPFPVCFSNDKTPKVEITELVFASKNGIILSKDLSRKVKQALGFIDKEAKNHLSRPGLDLFFSRLNNDVSLGEDVFLILSKTKIRSLIVRKEKQPPSANQLKRDAIEFYEIEV